MPGDGFALETLRRGDAVPQPALAEHQGDPGPAPALAGAWCMVSGSMDGHAMDARLVQTGKRVSKGAQLTVLFSGQPYMQARITLDPSKKSIDYALSTGATQRGIYQLEGQTLKLCTGTTKRPTDFEPGPGRTLTVWKRTSS
jgi:uncharacterized protein (TIGR03067 family)